ncbi:MAG: type III-B CRISPR module RAMP protein Cmr6 [Anaerolineaceae bacterium]|nr:type III-B CRISPR module RAMP protein Cmr6 [Anaerolineaceae bacterium]
MSNQALPKRNAKVLEDYGDQCRNLGLILDKFVPWGWNRRDKHWDIVIKSTVRRSGNNEIRDLYGGEAKGIWLNVNRQALAGESPSLFEVDRVDVELMRAVQDRWQTQVKGRGGFAFTMRTAERLAVGLGASHVLETALTLDRNTGLPYLPGSSVKGLARAWGLIKVAAQLGITLDTVVHEKGKERNALNILSDMLASEPEKIGTVFPIENNEQAANYIDWFRFIFGSQANAGAVCFLDAIYAGSKAPGYAADVMTPHYVNYYTTNGGSPPAEDDNPNPVSFITVDHSNIFAFGLVLRRAAFANQPLENQKTALDTAANWLQRGLTDLGAGSKTAAGYGFFNRKSMKVVVSPSA